MSKHRNEALAVEAPADDLAQTVKNIIHDELGHMIADIEFRLGRMAELERRQVALLEAGAGQVASSAIPNGSIYVEDVVSGRHAITGYTATSNTPGLGQISWTNLRVVYNGVDYAIANGSAPVGHRYVWFQKPATGTSATLITQQSMPSLGPSDALIFVNDDGVVISALETSIPAAVADRSVGTNALMDDAVTNTKILGVDGGKVSGTLGLATIPSLPFTKMTGSAAEGQIPSLPFTKMTGTASDAQIPSLSPSKISGAGTFAETQIPSLTEAKIPVLTVGKIPSLPFTKMTGTADVAQVPSLPFTKMTGSAAEGQIPNLPFTKMTGSVTEAQVGTGTISASKFNTLFHVIY